MATLFSRLWIVLFLCGISACATQKHTESKSMQVIRDCTGTYLRIDAKDYHVCNVAALASFGDGQIVSVKFEETADCSEQPEMVCMMFHENQGWIKIVD